MWPFQTGRHVSSFESTVNARTSSAYEPGLSAPTGQADLGLGARLAAASADLLVAECAADGGVRFASAALLAALDLTLLEIQRLRHEDLVSSVEAGARQPCAVWRRALAGEAPVGLYRLTGRAGRSVWMEGAHGVLRGADGAPAAVLLCGVDVTRKHHRQIDYEGQLRAITHSLPVIEFDMAGHILGANERFLQQMGYRFEELVGRHQSLLLTAEDAAGDEYAKLWEGLRAGRFGAGRFRRVAKGGRCVWIVASIHPIIDDRGEPFKVVEYASDITERAAMDQALQASEFRFRGLFELSPVGIVLSEAKSGKILEANDAFLRSTGYAREELLGTALAVAAAGGLQPVVCAQHRDRRFGPLEVDLSRRDGTPYPVLIAGMQVRDAAGRDVVWSIVQDISQRKALEHELTVAARTDKLTGLCNRAEFVRRLQAALAQRIAQPGALCAVLFLDLDRFKLINDTLGHDAGDALLRAFAERLRSALRLSDVGDEQGTGNVVARFGGDEFAVLLTDLRDTADAVAVGQRLLESGSRVYQLAGREVHSSVSAGIVTTRGEDTAENIMRNADVAMYEAKHAGKRRCVLFNEAMQVRLTRELTIENALRGAVGTDQLHLVYQPIVDLESRHVVSAEALLRWTHPELGVISPAEFIPIAEDSGLIIPIGQWVLEQACRQFMAWRAVAPQRAPRTISVNVARAQLALGDLLVEQIAEVLTRFQVPRDCLQVEITEREVMRDPDLSVRLLDAIHRLGVRLAMDDFGTGASSLGCLRAYPFDTIKIDRTFLGGLDGERDVLAVLHATVTLIENLGKSSVAEGIESPMQVAILQSLGCRLGQGYLLGRPTPAANFPL